MSEFALRPESGALSHEGRVRSDNEDSYFTGEEIGLWAVADGMGGHEKGERASAVVVEQLGRPVAATDFEEACVEIADRIHRANGLIYEEAEAQGAQMGTTVVALYARGRRFAIFWVGDSRSYLLRQGVLHRLSKDHSQVQEMLDRGLLTPQEAEGHPMSHILARAVGVAPMIDVDVVADEVEAGDTFLLCSDGLHGYVPDEEIAARLAGHPVEAVARGLVEVTMERGAPDNVTVIAIRFAEPTLLALSAGGAA
jgi:serine/threonine protein phosphatase PrpC